MKAYKFRPNFKDTKYLPLLTDNMIWFASPQSFNDPSDCRVPLRYALESKENQRKHFHKLLMDFEPSLSMKEKDTRVENLIDFIKDKSNEIQMIREKENLINKRIGIFSMAGNYRNILLWSHYADGHKGFCIEYDIKRLGKYFLEQSQNNKIDVLGEKIEYSTILPILLPSQLEGYELYRKQFAIKYKDWQYEEEFRLISHEKSDMWWPIPEESITSIFVGCRMDEDSITSIKEAISKMAHKPNLIRAIKNFDSYELQFERIDY